MDHCTGNGSIWWNWTLSMLFEPWLTLLLKSSDYYGALPCISWSELPRNILKVDFLEQANDTKKCICYRGNNVYYKDQAWCHPSDGGAHWDWGEVAVWPIVTSTDLSYHLASPPRCTAVSATKAGVTIATSGGRAGPIWWHGRESLLAEKNTQWI